MTRVASFRLCNGWSSCKHATETNARVIPHAELVIHAEVLSLLKQSSRLRVELRPFYSLNGGLAFVNSINVPDDLRSKLFGAFTADLTSSDLPTSSPLDDQILKDVRATRDRTVVLYGTDTSLRRIRQIIER